MAMYQWSQTPNSNANVDPNINWAEGQAPSSINDSARRMMAETAKYRDDISGAIVTGGTSTAYTVASYQNFASVGTPTGLPALNGQMIAFTPHVTNGATVTLNVDGLGAKPLRTAPNAELLAGTIIQGTPYVALYNNSDGAFYLQNFFSNPYNIPLGATLEYWLPTAPNSSFVFPYGQAINRTTYATLFAAMGTAYGAGDGTTTFNLPDLRGRGTACPDNMGAGDAARLAGGNCALASVRFSLGGAGGEGSHSLSASELPGHTHSGQTGTMNQNTTHNHSSSSFFSGGQGPGGVGGGGGFGYAITANTSTANIDHTHNFTTDNGAVGNTAHNNMQPTILCNRILRVI